MGERMGKKKMAHLPPIKAGRGQRWVFVFLGFLLMPGSGGDRRSVYANECASVYVLARIVAGLIRQHFPGTREDVGEGPCGS